MTYNWQKAIDFVMKWEGGYVDDSNDPGGCTKYGISQRAYPSLNIETLTPDEAKAIYKKDYWDKLGCDAIGDKFDICTFNAAVNCGQERAEMWLSEARSWEDILLLQIFYYTTLAKKEKYRPYLLGWLNRTVDLFMVLRHEG